MSSPTLREYQSELIQKVYAAWEAGARSVMLQSMVGSGKTVIFSAIIQQEERLGNKCALLVHRSELIKQAYSTLHKFGVVPGIIQAGFSPSQGRSTQLCSIQTLVRRKGPARVDLIIVDEAHRGVAESYRKIYDQYPNARVLGVTATPWRSGKGGFEDVFDTLVEGPSVGWLIDRGYLVKPKVFAMPLQQDLKKVKITSTGDYDERQLAEIMDRAQIHGDLVKSYAQKGDGRRCIVFAVNVEHSKHIVEQYRAAGYAAEHLDGSSPDHVRARVIELFKKGHIQILSNCNLFTEGFDVPDCGVIQLARPTKSLVMYIQSVGRAMRPADNKDNCIVLDHGNSVFEHGLPHEDREWSLKGRIVRKVKAEDPQREFLAKKEGGEEQLVEAGRVLVNELVELMPVPENYTRPRRPSRDLAQGAPVTSEQVKIDMKYNGGGIEEALALLSKTRDIYASIPNFKGSVSAPAWSKVVKAVGEENITKDFVYRASGVLGYTTTWASTVWKGILDKRKVAEMITHRDPRHGGFREPPF